MYGRGPVPVNSLLLFILLSCGTAVKVAERKMQYLRHRKKTTYQLHENVRTTYFYVGQYEDAGGRLLDNRSSAWTGDWVGAYGGVDHPRRREGYLPRGFTPRENPFYCALPYNDIVHRGRAGCLSRGAGPPGPGR